MATETQGSLTYTEQISQNFVVNLNSAAKYYSFIQITRCRLNETVDGTSRTCDPVVAINSG